LDHAREDSWGQEEDSEQIVIDLPKRHIGGQRFYLLLLVAFLLFYPLLDPVLFGAGTAGRLAGYGDAGFYVVLALGLNIVVGFAGLLDLGYVAFFAIGAYCWGVIGSGQFTVITGVVTNPQIWPWLFWPMLLVIALFTALWGVVLGVPTLRLHGDYLALVTLGFGEIIPIIFLEMDRYTNGANGIIGVISPAFPGVRWSAITPLPYYYLILALIAFTIFVNMRLRDSRFGRAWLAVRDDEVMANAVGINLVHTKLFAFAAGAFFSGIAGAYHAAKLGFVSPDDFNYADSIIYLTMVVVGGAGSIPGAVLGALVVYVFNQIILSSLDSWASDPTSPLHGLSTGLTHVIPGFSFGNIRELIFGAALVTLMIFRPQGLWPPARRERVFEAVQDEDEAVEMLELDPQEAEEKPRISRSRAIFYKMFSKKGSV
jgi:ABC-type branched-subunit amino acid transport system permease subunit